ncbi:serine hydrolase domain-containing protein [Ornithinimicrobium tianjinense]|uniref:Serine hydrolase n=1 Tax=Ornithinimicrobium tianjinense TaxID=1195761 RepID=A0A917F3V6_9MICO|nr:serine hydrolase domain-containing protein [Ornithinimicrobium tianjinense]GGF42876.1 serine hydrolase [Ornithinimicrobium tianjinense]
MSEPRWQALAEQATRLERDEGFSGILRVARGEEVLHESCHGLANRADGIPVHPGTRFATASLSKMFTAVAVLDAAGRGEVGLTDRVVDVLPPHRRPVTLREDVTVEHLLLHTSGIADYAEEDEDLPGYVADYGSIWADLPVYRVRDGLDVLPLFADLPPVCPPGTAYHYSNAGYVLLGIVLTEVCGLPFAEAVTSRVLRPAGMTGSGYLAMNEVHPDVATGYLPPLLPGGPARTNIYSVPALGIGDGGAFVTAGDVARFFAALAQAWVWRGVTPELALTPRAPGWPGFGTSYVVVVRDDGVVGKAGGDPGVATIGRFRPSDGTTAVLLANVGWEDVPGLGDLVDAMDAAAFAAG